MSYESLVIEIRNPLVDSADKFEKALKILAKATKTDFELDHSHGVEPTPYKALRELTDNTSDQVQDGLFDLWSAITKDWLGLTLSKAKGSDSYKLNGKIFINPKSGKPLTITEWKIIQKDLTKIFGRLYGNTKDALTKKAIAMGKILHGMNEDDRYLTGSDNLNLDLFTDTAKPDDIYRHTLAYADVHTGEMIQNITSKGRMKIVDRIMSAYANGDSSKQLRDTLFEDFSVMNRDFRMIAETETANNFNAGYLKAEIKAHKGTEPIFMLGISGAGACAHCAGKVDGTVVVLLENPPASGETVVVDGETYIAIWPGKSNYGRSRKDWWVASGTQHPHCRCTWTQYGAGIAEYTKKLKDAMST